MQRKQLGELNLLDNFLFGSLMTYPDFGEEFVRDLLRVIFQKDFGKLKVEAQKVLYGENTGLHGARLDVYLEEEKDSEAITEFAERNPQDSVVVAENGTVYDIEPDKNDSKKDVQALPRRVRFYHAKIDSAILKAGKDYDELKRVIVIFITDYDPFGRNRVRYTIRNKCEEEPDMPYNDGAETIFLYTGGTEGNPTEELRQFLHYMEHTTRENAVNETLKSIQKMVETVKKDGEVSLAYMKNWERDRMIYEEGHKEGQQLMNLLVQRLIADNRLEDLQKSTTDPEYQQKLMVEYGIAVDECGV